MGICDRLSTAKCFYIWLKAMIFQFGIQRQYLDHRLAYIHTNINELRTGRYLHKFT